MIKIYKIFDYTDNKIIYIGQTKQSLQKRFFAHLRNNEQISNLNKIHKLEIQLIKNVADEIAYKEETKCTIIAYKENNMLLNKQFGHFEKNKVLQYINKPADEIINILYNNNKNKKSLTIKDNNKYKYVYTHAKVLLFYNYGHETNNYVNYLLTHFNKKINSKLVNTTNEFYITINSKTIKNIRKEKRNNFDNYITIFEGNYNKANEILFKFGILCVLHNVKLLNKQICGYSKQAINELMQYLKYPNYKNIVKDYLANNDSNYRIYKISNIINNYIYIGRTNDSLLRRLRKHFSSTKWIKNLIKEYDKNIFKIEEIGLCNSLEETRKLEYKITIKHINQHYKLYNLRIGDKLSEQENKQLNKYRKRSYKAWNKGKHLSQEHKDKIKEKLKGKRPSEKCLQRSLEVHTGTKQSIETINKRIKTRSLKIRCITLNKIYNSVKEVCNEYNINRKALYMAIYRNNYCGEYNGQKLKWEYVKN